MSTATVEMAPVRRRSFRGSLTRNRRWALILSYVFLVMFAIFFLAPPYYMIVTSLKSNVEVAQLSSSPWFVADGVTLKHYFDLMTKTLFPTFFKNTVVVTLCSVAVTMVVSILAAFSLARMRFWGSGVFATGIFLTYLIPESLLFIPLF